jgi:long-chain acyl-CoA synthetase
MAVQRSPPGVTFTIAGLIRAQAGARPGKTEIAFAGRDVTYADLDRRSNQAARALRATGVCPGDRVAVIDRNGPEFFDLLFGAAKVGAVLVAVNWRLSPPEMAFIINDSTTSVLVLGHEAAEQLDAMGELPRVHTKVVIGKGYEEWLATADSTDPGVTTTGDDVVTQVYTSGTTGLPKGALITNSNLGTLLQLLSDLMGVHERSVTLSVMPLYHVAGSAGALLGVYSGATVVLHREVNPAAIVDAIESDRITFTNFVPAVIQMVLAVPGVGERDFSSIEAVAYGASPISEAVMLRASEVFGRLYQLYGLTETTGVATALPPEAVDRDHPERLRSAGTVLAGHELRIAGADGRDLSAGEVGEVCVRGPLVMKGYWNRPEATTQAIDPDGWFHSGDAGYLDDAGYLYIRDRIKDMIISGAENVYPAEVENVLMGHAAVADAAAIGIPDDRWGEAVKAVLVRAPGCETSDADIIAYCRTRLAGFKCPTSIDWVDALPRNPSGKILKRELREPYWAGRARVVN